MNKYDTIPVYTAEEFDTSLLTREVQKWPPKRKKREFNRSYLNHICAFDIETSRLEWAEQSIMYIWQFCIDGNIIVIGRTWEELDLFFSKLAVYAGEDWFCVHVHNLAYEFQFLQAITDWSDGEVFAIDKRKPVKASIPKYHIEFRCSYIHSNMSLAEYTNKMRVQHTKLSGDLDYSIIRFPWTPLTEKELAYCLNDVVGLCEAIKVEMDAEQDTLYTFPLTSTGYVRRGCKRAMYPERYKTKEILPDYEVYKRLREAFRGGNTHANRYFAGRILYDVHSYDRSSSYPDVIANCKFPMTEFVPCTEIPKDKAFLLTIIFYKIRLTNEFEPVPYLSVDKCRGQSHPVKDNGRILSADELETTITDVDYKIISSMYTWDDCKIISCYSAEYGYLPQAFRDENNKYYRLKTELKGVKGQEIYYMKSKNKLNSEYGMTAQDPVKQSILFSAGDWSIAEDDPEELLEKYNSKAFLAYQWGVWVTAWARYRLQEGIDLIKNTPGCFVIYCDTDSVKYLGGADWGEYNAIRQADSEHNGAQAVDPAGVAHYMGVYEHDEEYYRFITMGAKKYAFQLEQGGQCYVTVSGVGKKAGGKELTAKGGLEAFKPGFVFVDAGGNEIVYNDHPEISEVKIGNRTIKIYPNAVIRPSTYTLGYTKEYYDLIGSCQEVAKLYTDFPDFS